MSASTVAAVVALGVAVAAGAGALLAWWLHRFTRLSPRNLYLAWCGSVPAALAAAGALREGAALAVRRSSYVLTGLGSQAAPRGYR